MPTISAAVRALPVKGVVLDGELVAIDAKGQPVFYELPAAVAVKPSAYYTRSTRATITDSVPIRTDRDPAVLQPREDRGRISPQTALALHHLRLRSESTRRR